MKLKTIQLYLILFALSFFTSVVAQNTNPVVSSVAFSISGTTVTVTYDVTDAEEATVNIQMKVSNDGGATYNYSGYSSTATGDIGANVTTGTNKTITWEYTGNYTDVFKFKIIANDETTDGSTCPGTPTVNYGGQIYNTIQIGDQCWLKENLNIGTMINGDSDQTNNSTIEKYCYNNNEGSCTQYGGLYQWDEAMQYVKTEGAQGICPTGWHIPTYTEFQTLKTTVNQSANALKSVGSGTGTNISGFSSLLVGSRLVPNGNFAKINTHIYFWSSTEDGSDAYNMHLYNDFDYVYFLNNSKDYGISIRCLKD